MTTAAATTTSATPTAAGVLSLLTLGWLEAPSGPGTDCVPRSPSYKKKYMYIQNYTIEKSIGLKRHRLNWVENMVILYSQG